MFSIEDLKRFEEIINATERDIKAGAFGAAGEHLDDLEKEIDAFPENTPTKQEGDNRQ